MGIVTTVLIAQSTQGPGQITSPVFVAPQAIPVPFFELFAVMNPADIADTTLVIGLALQILNSTTGVWQTVVSAQWKGNSIVDKNAITGQAPYVSWNATSVHGVQCRGILTLPRAVSIGLSGRITT